MSADKVWPVWLASMNEQLLPVPLLYGGDKEELTEIAQDLLDDLPGTELKIDRVGHLFVLSHVGDDRTLAVVLGMLWGRGLLT